MQATVLASMWMRDFVWGTILYCHGDQLKKSALEAGGMNKTAETRRHQYV